MPYAIRDNTIIIPALRDGAPTTGPLTALPMTESGSYFTEPIDVGNFIEAIAFILAAGKGGTSPTIDCDIQYSPDKINWVNSGDSFTQLTANGLGFKKFTANFGKYIRFRIGIGGTAHPTYTVSMKVVAKG